MLLVTGGAGYIGSHTSVELLSAGHDVVVYDNFANSSPKVLDRIEELAGRRPILVEADLRDGAALRRVFSEHPIEGVIHFAGLKAVGESVAEPLRYYDHNVVGTVRLLEAMAEAGCAKLVFSSSATVYGVPEVLPIPETAALSATSPYGQTKLTIEHMLRDVAASDAASSFVLLRYFNPVGAHPSGRIGEDPRGIPNNLMPFVTQVAIGRREFLGVFGDDYDTVDGTGVRDYIHVVDLAKGHLRACEKLRTSAPVGCVPVNLGTGRGYSVLQVVEAFSHVLGRPLPYRIAPRRPGDVPVCFADARFAEEFLGWRAELDLDAMCRDSWRFQQANPDGIG